MSIAKIAYKELTGITAYYDQITLIAETCEGMDNAQALDFLCDGEALAAVGIVNEKAVETIYNCMAGEK